MSNRCTHILIEFPSQDTTLLYRAADGMALACRSGTTVISGADPNPAKKSHRNFLTPAFATGYLRRLADLDENGIADEADRTPRQQMTAYAIFDERHGESKIVHAGSALGLRN